MIRLFAMCTVLTKADADKTTNRQVLGHRWSESKEEAVGSFVLSVLDANAGFSVGEILTVEIEAKPYPSPGSFDQLQEQTFKRFRDGSHAGKLKPFLDPKDYDALRDYDKFLYNRGPKPEGLE